MEVRFVTCSLNITSTMVKLNRDQIYSKKHAQKRKAKKQIVALYKRKEYWAKQSMMGPTFAFFFSLGKLLEKLKNEHEKKNEVFPYRDTDIYLGCYFRARILFLEAEESVPEEIERGFSVHRREPLPVFDDIHHEAVFNLVQGHPVLLNDIVANALLLGR
ncbi:hypothetical protein EDC96DRAFT_501118, partial [Choanephora cucurbitarum]